MTDPAAPFVGASRFRSVGEERGRAVRWGRWGCPAQAVRAGGRGVRAERELSCCCQHRRALGDAIDALVPWDSGTDGAREVKLKVRGV